MSRALTCACILAAGSGLRLGEGGQGQPKAFIRLGARPIIEESIERLRRSGIERIVIVTGYAAECFEPLRGNGIELVHNPRFAETGSLWSLCCAREALGGDFLLVESDLIYETRALEALQESPHDDVLLASGFTGSGDEVWVSTRNGYLLGMSKRRGDLEPGTIVGEMVGISRISAAFHARLLAASDELFGRGLIASHYDTDGIGRCAAEWPVACPVIPDLAWAEIDDASHLERARTLIHPAIAARTR